MIFSPSRRTWAGWGVALLLLAGCTAATPAPVRVAAGPPLALDLEPEELTIKRAAGHLYTVRPGDTLWAIAMVHEVDVEDMAAWNRIDNPDLIAVGQQLVVKGKTGGGFAAINTVKKAPPPQRVKGTNPPEEIEDENKDAAATALDGHETPPSQQAPTLARPAVIGDGDPSPPAPPEAPPLSQSQQDTPLPDMAPEHRTEEPAAPETADVPPLRREGEKTVAAAPTKPVRPAKNTWVVKAGPPQQWLWPAGSKQLLTKFGTRGSGRPSTGIDIAAKRGDPVFAAADGVVAYADSGLPGYGNLLIVRHGGSYMTAYAHNAELLVQRGEVVKAGQTIAKVGSSGRVNSPRLHFELRRGITPINPMQHLPHP